MTSKCISRPIPPRASDADRSPGASHMKAHDGRARRWSARHCRPSFIPFPLGFLVQLVSDSGPPFVALSFSFDTTRVVAIKERSPHTNRAMEPVTVQTLTIDSIPNMLLIPKPTLAFEFQSRHVPVRRLYILPPMLDLYAFVALDSVSAHRGSKRISTENECQCAIKSQGNTVCRPHALGLQVARVPHSDERPRPCSANKHKHSAKRTFGAPLHGGLWIM